MGVFRAGSLQWFQYWSRPKPVCWGDWLDRWVAQDDAASNYFPNFPGVPLFLGARQTPDGKRRIVVAFQPVPGDSVTDFRIEYCTMIPGQREL